MLYKKINITALFVFALFITQAFAQFPPETPWGVPVNPSDLPMPEYLETVQDLNYAVEFTRLGDVTEFSNFAGFAVSDGSTRHHYAKTQAWNADNTLLHFGTIFFLNGNDYTLFKTIDWAGINDSRWSNTDPDILYFFDADDFKKINVRTDAVTTIRNFPGYVHAGMGPWEGNLSADDRYVVVTDYDEATGEGRKASVYDIKNDVLLGTYTGHFDWATMTPSGNYVVVSNNDTDQIERYDLNFQNMFVVISGQEHGDFGVDVNGEEVFVQVIPLSMTRLSDGVNTDLLPETASTSGTCGENNYNPNIAGHISCRNFNLPGWAIVSAGTHPCWNNQGYDWRTEIFAVKLDYSGMGTIRFYGYSRTSASSSIATVSQDGTKILFASDWDIYGNGGTDNLTYLVEYNQALPVTWLSPLTAKVINNQIHLNWSVSEQQNNRQFLIEHSTDGRIFHTIGQFKEENRLSSTQKYTFAHRNPVNGINYYRIKQQDYDGHFTYGNIAQVSFENKDISIFPIPAKERITIRSNNYDSFAIYNQLGVKLIIGRLVPGDNAMDLSGFKAGVYYLRTGFGDKEKVILY